MLDRSYDELVECSGRHAATCNLPVASIGLPALVLGASLVMPRVETLAGPDDRLHGGLDRCVGSRNCPMTAVIRAILFRQCDMAWQLMRHRVESLTTEECPWRPGLHVHLETDGTWHADWPEHEGYDRGPSSLSWLTWHARFWHGMVVNHSFGAGTLSRQQLPWPGSAQGVRPMLGRLHDEWRSAVDQMGPDEWSSDGRTRSPFAARPFCDVVARASVELTKSAAEIGCARFPYAVRPR